VGSYNITFTATNVAGTVTQNFTLVISGPQVTLSPTSMSFSNIKCSTYSTQTETVTNTGNGVLTISNVSLTLGQGSDSDDFEVKNYCSGSLAPAKSCTINVTYSPDEKGPQNATLVVIDNAPGGHQNVPIVGTNTCKDEGGGGE